MKTTIKRPMRKELNKGKALVRSEVVKKGLRGNTLSEMASRGVLYRVARGVYVSAAGSDSEYFDYETASKVVKNGVFTLRSALRLHNLTDENPLRMTVAIPESSHAPKTTLPIDFVYMKKELLFSDVAEFNFNGSAFSVFSIERTIVECFKARRKIGIGVCVAALNEAIEQSRINWNYLWDVMKRCRMTRVMGPYLEGRV